MIKRVVGDLGSILADAQERGMVAQNVVRSLSERKKKRTKAEQRRKLKVGVDIPTPEEIKAIMARQEALPARALLLVVIFTGLRSSELRGLAWPHTDLKKDEGHVCARAAKYDEIDK